VLSFLAISLILVAINSIAAIGLNIQFGYAGMVNLMSITCLAVGGYTTLVLMLPPAGQTQDTYILGLNLPFPLAVVGGIIAAGLFGLIVGAIALRRVRAHYFAIVTFAVAEMAHQFIGNFKPLFNGPTGVSALSLPFVDVVGFENFNYFYLGISVVILAVVFLFAEFIRRRPLGRVLRAIREDQDVVRAFGRNVYRVQLLAFAIGSALAGLAGGLLVGFTGTLDPSGWSSLETLALLTGLILGGAGNNFGVLLGMVVVAGVITQGVTFLPSGLIPNTIQSPVEVMVYGAILIVILRFRPAGLIPERPERDRIRAERSALKPMPLAVDK
jgi:branched-chain amino acid transport system permease protein